MPPRRWIRAALGLSLLLAGSACTDSQPPPTRGGSIRVEGEEPGSLDPAHADDPSETRIVRNLFRGLVRFDEHRGSLQGASASKWEISSDAVTFVFYLRQDNKFSNGEPVRAENFVRAFERATAPAESSPVAPLFSEVLGYRERHMTGASPNLAGVDALDEYTLRIRLSAPDAEFISKLAHPAFSPVPSDATMLSRQPTWGEAPIGNGPWQLKEPWKHNESIVLKPNPMYTGPDKPNLSEAVFVLLDDVSVSYEQWLAGNVDWSSIPAERMNEVRSQNPDQTVTGVTPRLVFLVALGSPPTNVKEFRQALSLAIDRAAIARSGTWGGLAASATGVIPPGVPGYQRPNTEGIGACPSCRFDLVEARRILTASKVRVPKSLDLNFTPVGNQDRWVEAIANSWKQNLGINSDTTSVRPFSDYVDALHKGQLSGFAAFEIAMTMSSPDSLLYTLFHSSSVGQLNLGRYKSADADRLLAAARGERDTATRIELYQQAEARILQDLPIIPLWWLTEVRLARLSKFDGLEMDLFGDPTITTAFLKPTK